MNYKQMPINNGHPFGVLRMRHALINLLRQRDNQTDKREMPLGVMAHKDDHRGAVRHVVMLSELIIL